MPYSGDPTTSPTDEVRFLSQDTDPAQPFLTDAEVAYLLGQARQHTALAAVYAVESILAKLAPQACDQSLGPGSISYSQIFKNFQTVLAQLKARQGVTGVRAYAGGIDRFDKRIREHDPRAVRPNFSKLEGQTVGGRALERRWPWLVW